MNAALTIVMYHYVRPIAHSAYPGIRGRELTDFIGQLDYIARHYTVVSPLQVLSAMRGETVLPPMALLLTFDDGYADHYQYVFPELMKRGWSGMFFVPARAVTHGEMLDVNKIHFILASGASPDALNERLDRMVQENKQAHGLKTLGDYHTEYKVANRFDTAEVIYLKRMLQVALPLTLRQEITQQLFEEFVQSDSVAFARELYMREEQLREMNAAGMTIGGHGNHHRWLNQLSALHQEEEIAASLSMLDNLNIGKPHTFCYPYGGYNGDTLEILKKQGCALAVTTHVGLAELSKPLELARLDTNDLPVAVDAEEAAWTKQAACGI